MYSLMVYRLLSLGVHFSETNFLKICDSGFFSIHNKYLILFTDFAVTR